MEGGFWYQDVVSHEKERLIEKNTWPADYDLNKMTLCSCTNIVIDH